MPFLKTLLLLSRTWLSCAEVIEMPAASRRLTGKKMSLERKKFKNLSLNYHVDAIPPSFTMVAMFLSKSRFGDFLLLTPFFG